MTSWLDHGVPPGADRDLVKRIRLGNALGGALVGICAAYLVGWWVLGEPAMAAICVGMTLGSALCVALIRTGHHVSGRLVLIVANLIGVFALGVVLGPRANYQIILLNGIALPSVVFTRRERALRWVSVALSVGLLVVLVAQVLAPLAITDRSDLFFRLAHANGGLISLFFLALTIQALLMENAEGEARLEQSLARSRAIVEHMVDGLIAVDRDGDVLLTNPALRRLLGPIDPDEALRGLLDEALSARGVARRELELPDGRVALAVASPIGQSGVVAIVRDVTIEREVDRMKSNFIATVSHELRTPLTSLLGFASLSRKKLVSRVFPHVPDTDAKARAAVDTVSQNLEIMIAEGSRLTTLINDVLDLSKMESGRMEWARAPVDVGALVDRAAAATRSLFGGRAVKLEVDVEDGLPPITGDFDRLLQMVINLVSNARKFTERGLVSISARRDGDAVAIAVRDTGIGIPPDQLEVVFEKFRQVQDGLTKTAGTGLGLPISREIAHAHGGTLTVESEVGAGSCFTARLPAG